MEGIDSSAKEPEETEQINTQIATPASEGEPIGLASGKIEGRPLHITSFLDSDPSQSDNQEESTTFTSQKPSPSEEQQFEEDFSLVDQTDTLSPLPNEKVCFNTAETPNHNCSSSNNSISMQDLPQANSIHVVPDLPQPNNSVPMFPQLNTVQLFKARTSDRHRQVRTSATKKKKIIATKKKKILNLCKSIRKGSDVSASSSRTQTAATIHQTPVATAVKVRNRRSNEKVEGYKSPPRVFQEGGSSEESKDHKLSPSPRASGKLEYGSELNEDSKSLLATCTDEYTSLSYPEMSLPVGKDELITSKWYDRDKVTELDSFERDDEISWLTIVPSPFLTEQRDLQYWIKPREVFATHCKSDSELVPGATGSNDNVPH